MPGALPNDAKRILVYGVTGSGKSTLARAISETLGIPWHSIDDQVGWLPGWVERPRDEQRAIVSGIVASEAWVLDTSYGHWRDLVLARAQVIVALDYRRLVSLGRLLRRTARRLVTHEAVCNANTESLRLALSSRSILAWHFRSFSSKRRSIARWLADPASPPVVRLSTPRATERWLVALGGDAPPRGARGPGARRSDRRPPTSTPR